MNNDYSLISTINEEHNIYLVKNNFDNNVYVKKKMSVFNKDVYDYIFTHPVKGIPRIHELYIDNNELIVIEEYVSGQNLETLMKMGMTFHDTEIVRIVNELCNILIGLNAKDSIIIHRDIKPSNIILKDDGSIYLIDFNAAKFMDASKERDTVLIGTKGYAAPEQYGFGSSTIQTDIYAIGILIRELKNDKNLDDSSLDQIINKCTEIDPKNRYQTIESLKNALPKEKETVSRNHKLLGFRKGKTINKILSAIGHILIPLFWFGLGTNANSGMEDWLNSLFFTLVSYFHLYFLFNYGNIQQEFGVNNNWQKWKKILYLLIINVLLLAAEIFVYVMIGATIFK